MLNKNCDVRRAVRALILKCLSKMCTYFRKNYLLNIAVT